MGKFPVDAPLDRVLAALMLLEFHVVRRGNHISMIRQNSDGTSTPLTLPNHRQIKASTLRKILTQSSITRDEFLAAYERA
ncbi:MAG: type II toxin-antitoxin system HicA family toxin [Planctomycetota bacterium]